MICLVKNYYLLRKTSIHFTYILDLDIFLYFLTNSPSKGDQNKSKYDHFNRAFLTLKYIYENI